MKIYPAFAGLRYIVSDCDAVEVAYDDAHYTRTPEDAVANALLAGKDHLFLPYITKSHFLEYQRRNGLGVKV